MEFFLANCSQHFAIQPRSDSKDAGSASWNKTRDVKAMSSFGETGVGSSVIAISSEP